MSASSESVSVPSEFYSTLSMFPFLPDQYVKYRFLAGPLSLILLPAGRINVTFDAESTIPWSVDVLGRVGRMVRLLQQRGATISIAIGESSRSPAARIKESPRLPADLVNGLALCEVARSLVNESGESLELQVRLEEIVRFQRELGFVSAALNPRTFNIEVLNLDPNSIDQADRQVGREVDAFVGPYVEIGGKTIAPLIVLEGIASKNPETGETRVENPTVRLLKVKTLAPGESGKLWWDSEQPHIKGRPGAEVVRIDPPYA